MIENKCESCGKVFYSLQKEKLCTDCENKKAQEKINQIQTILNN